MAVPDVSALLEPITDRLDRCGVVSAAAQHLGGFSYFPAESRCKRPKIEFRLVPSCAPHTPSRSRPGL